jgi:hypothetical protein
MWYEPILPKLYRSCRQPMLVTTAQITPPFFNGEARKQTRDIPFELDVAVLQVITEFSRVIVRISRTGSSLPLAQSAQRQKEGE